MTLQDLWDQGVIIQGMVTVNLMDENANILKTFHTNDFEYDFDFPVEFFKYEIKFIYWESNGIKIEILKKEEN